jgi:uncharacterized DUF497 family protein
MWGLFMGKTIISKNDRFEWDEEKDELNRKKHGFGFAEILQVFDDPFFSEAWDIEHSRDETRYFGVGRINELLFILVFYTERGRRTRIISARLADKRDKEAYYDNYRNFDTAEDG